MTISHDPETRNELAALTTELLEVGTTFANVALLLYAAGGALLVVLPMATPAFQPPVAGMCVANPIPQALPLLTGTPASFQVRGRDGISRIFGTVGAPGSGADLEGVGDIEIGKPVQIDSYVYQAPP